MKNKKGFLDISFSWIFAIIIGIMILVGAIYGVNKFSNLKNTENSAELGTALKNLLIPLETGVESTKSITITLPVQSRITHSCKTFGTFGTETFSVEEKVMNKWTHTGVDISFEDKYIFLPRIIEGQKFNVFSKSFEFPFKVANLIYFTNSKLTYCFIGFPTKTKIEIENLNQNNFEVDSCSDNSTKICYGGTGSTVCDIKVDPSENSVSKEGDKVYYIGNALMYAAIFSDKLTYECEVSRLMKRANELTTIYSSKASSLDSRGCYSSVDFTKYRDELTNYKNSANLGSLSYESGNMNSLNQYSTCRLW